MLGRVCGFAPEKRYGRIHLYGQVCVLFLASGVIGDVHYGDWVDFWLADNPRPRYSGELLAVEVQRRDPASAPKISVPAFAYR